MVVQGGILAIIGLLCIFKPDFIWDVTESWKSISSDGPSGPYITMARITGVLMVIGGLYFMFVI